MPNSRRRLQSIVILRSKFATKKLVLFYYFLQVELCKGLNYTLITIKLIILPIKLQPMHITILTNRDLASYLALKLLSRHLTDHNISIILSEAVGATKNHAQPLVDLATFENSILANNNCSFESLAMQSGYNLYSTATINNKINEVAGFNLISGLQPDLIISIRFGLIIDSDIINLPKYGVINLHSGILPTYRGVMASFRAMLDAAINLGTTLHYIEDKTIDTGSVISIVNIEFNPQFSYLLNVLNLYKSGCQQILDAVTTIKSGSSLKTIQITAKSNYYSFPTERELSKFFAMGYKLFCDSERAVISTIL